MIDDKSGAKVPADISARSGGHSCNSGVLFELWPKASLRPGYYTLVLLLESVRWPLVSNDERDTFQGKPAMVRHFVVDGGREQTPTAPEAG